MTKTNDNEDTEPVEVLESPSGIQDPPPRAHHHRPSAVEVPVWSDVANAVNNLKHQHQHQHQHPDANEEPLPSAETQSDTQDDQQVKISATTPAYHIQVDLPSMKDSVYFLFPDLKDRLSRFWILLFLASVIATSGIVSDSPATVIGAMIVAPLMTPILGTMLSIVLMDPKNFGLSLLLCITGIGSCILVGFVYGNCVNDDLILKENNSQVMGRVQPKIPDLVGAIATGAVGSIALVRKDIAGALPGVAISISLVPPLCVAGLMGSIGQHTDMGGALLLFVTNFMSIQVTGIMVMYVYKVHLMAVRPHAKLFLNVALVMTVLLGLVAIPLSVTSNRIAAELNAEKCVKDVTDTFFLENGFEEWQCSVVVARSSGSTLEANVVAHGPPPIPQFVFPEQTSMMMIEEVEGWPLVYALNEECPDVRFLQYSYLPSQEVDMDELVPEEPDL